MSIQELIFWYTGAAVWAVIAVVFAIILVVVAAITIAAVYYHFGQWVALGLIGKGEKDRINVAMSKSLSPGGMNHAALRAWLERFRAAYEGVDYLQIDATYAALQSTFEEQGLRLSRAKAPDTGYHVTRPHRTSAHKVTAVEDLRAARTWLMGYIEADTWTTAVLAQEAPVDSAPSAVSDSLPVPDVPTMLRPKPAAGATEVPDDGHDAEPHAFRFSDMPPDPEWKD